MASDGERLTAQQIDRIYEQQIGAAMLEAVSPSPQPVAVLVGGQPGAGQAVLIQSLRSELRLADAAPVVVAPDELRAFHPRWRDAAARHSPDGVAETRPETELWGERLARDAVAKRANLVLDTSMRRPQDLLVLARHLKSQGYRVEALIVAADRDASRLGSVVRYERLLTRGAIARFVPRQEHEQAYDAVRESVSRLEQGKAVDRLRLITRDGRELFENTVVKNAWRQPEGAAKALEDYRERVLPAREKADNALRWHTLVARLQARSAEVPREVIAQVVDWRTQSTAQALADPEARSLYEAGLAAEAFRSLPGQQFVKEFAHYRAAVNKLEKARDYAAAELSQPADRARFVALARERIAEQIEQGRQYGRARGAEEQDKTR